MNEQRLLMSDSGPILKHDYTGHIGVCMLIYGNVCKSHGQPGSGWKKVELLCSFFQVVFARTKGMCRHKVTNTPRQQHLRSLTHVHTTLSKSCSSEATLYKVGSPFDWCHIWRCNRICCVCQVGAAWGPIEEESRVPISPAWSHVSPGMSRTFI